MLTTRAALATCALLLVASGCDGDDTASSSSTAATVPSADEPGSTADEDADRRQPEGASSFFSIDEVVLGPDGYVVLTNFTDAAVTLDGLHLCQGSDCFALPDETVPAGAGAYVSVGDTPDVEGVVIPGATVGELDPPDGELAVYVGDPDDPAAIVNYLEWGSTPHDRTDDAIANGLWLEGSYAPTGDNAVRLYRNLDSGLWLWDAAE